MVPCLDACFTENSSLLLQVLLESPPTLPERKMHNGEESSGDSFTCGIRRIDVLLQQAREEERTVKGAID